MRGDFSSQVAGKTIASHMITDGTTSWVWSDAAPQGMKMSFAGMNQPQQGQTAPASANTNAIDPTKNINYKCGGWAADQSQFTIPANITFTDMSEMMKNMQGMMGGKGAAAGAGATTGGSAAGAGAGAGAGSMCAQCNQIPDATAKAQCLSALGCK
jgi:hypothetical protein